MVTLFTLGIICLAAVILIPVILFLVGLPFLLLMGLLPWLLRIAGVGLLIKALLDMCLHILHVLHDHQRNLEGDGIFKHTKIQPGALLKLIQTVHQRISVDVKLS